MAIIKISKLCKNFGDVKALKNLSLDVEAGQILGLLGPNGAGKSTLIKTLVGGVRPTTGNVEVFGKNPLKERKRLAHKFGYMPQAACLYEDLTVGENVRFFAKLHRKRNAGKAIDDMLDFLGMGQKRDQRVSHLSGGMKTRVSLACAMIHEPEILFLDEPTAGLDPSLKRSLWELFHKLSSQGKTLFISTHLMDEALLCDNLAILREGTLLTKDTPERIIAKGEVTIELESDKLGKVSESLPADPQKIARWLHSYGLDKGINSLDVSKETLEDVTIAIVDGKEVRR